MGRKLSIENQKVLNEFELKLAKKYGPIWREYLPYEGKGGKYRKVNAISKATYKSNYRRRLASTTEEIINNLMEFAPLKTGYGRANMFKKIDRYNGQIILGTDGAEGGQTIGAPYMVHLNSPRFKTTSGWIDNAISSSERTADAENVIIWPPIYNYGLCAIKVRATENGIDDWWDDVDIEEEFL